LLKKAKEAIAYPCSSFMSRFGMSSSISPGCSTHCFCRYPLLWTPLCCFSSSKNSSRRRIPNHFPLPFCHNYHYAFSITLPPIVQQQQQLAPPPPTSSTLLRHGHSLSLDAALFTLLHLYMAYSTSMEYHPLGHSSSLAPDIVRSPDTQSDPWRSNGPITCTIRHPCACGSPTRFCARLWS
jgi:hypothetical protein